MRWFAVFCCAIAGLLLPAAEEITDLQPGPHASLAGQILTIDLPDGAADAGQPPAFRINLKRYAGGFVIGSIKVKTFCSGNSFIAAPLSGVFIPPLPVSCGIYPRAGKNQADCGAWHTPRIHESNIPGICASHCAFLSQAPFPLLYNPEKLIIFLHLQQQESKRCLTKMQSGI